MRLPLSILHILAGSIGLLTGPVVMSVGKGGKLRRASGNVFTVAMLTLATSAFFLAILKSPAGQHRRQRWRLLPDRHGLACRTPRRTHTSY
jgi:hypothetical protein